MTTNILALFASTFLVVFALGAQSLIVNNGRYARGTRQNESFAAATSGAVVEGRNKRSVWTIATSPYPEAHFATYPPELPEFTEIISPASGVLLVYESNATGNLLVASERRAKPCRDADKISAEQAIDVARLAGLRMWDALAALEQSRAEATTA